MNSHLAFYLFNIVSKLHRWIVSLVWRFFLLVYFGIGVGAFTLLLLIQAQFFAQITQNWLLGYVLAGIFEIAQVGASVMKQAIAQVKHIYKINVSLGVRMLSSFVQLALILLSLICSVVVIASVLDGSAIVPWQLAPQSSRISQALGSIEPHIVALLNLLRNGLGAPLNVNLTTWYLGFALFLSLLLQATMYMIFGHLLATQARELEYLFSIKWQRLNTKKNSMTNI